MTSPAKPSPEGEDNATVQRLAVAGGAFLIIVLTVIAAIFLAQAEQPETPVAVQESPAIIPTPTPFIPTPTPASLASPTPTPLPPITPSPSPEPAVDTPTPPPTATQPVVVTVTPSPTPVVIVVTPTPGPPQPTAPPSEGGSCQPPASWVVYTVQEGDTLNRLAERTGSSVRELQKYNCLKSFTLTPGQTIYLPEIPPTPTVTPTASATPLPQATPTRTPVPLAPQIDLVAPSQVDRAAADAGFTLTVTGKNFQPTAAGFRVALRGPANVPLNLSGQGSSTSFEAAVPPGLPNGVYDLVVTNPTERAGIKTAALTIGAAPPTSTPAAPPDIIRFTPQAGKISEDVVLTIQGTGFQAGPPDFKVELQSTNSSFRTTLELGTTRTDTTVTAIVRAGVLSAGNYTLIVTNPDGRSAIAEDSYQALSP